jgi:hypothetical protein
MKINEINPLATKQNAGKTQADATGFKDLLEARLNSVAGSAEVSHPAPVRSVSSSDPRIRLESLTLTENTIKVLDSYGSALNNPALTNDDLQPFISALEENASAIVDLRQQLKPEDPLAGLLDQVAAVTSLESAKYNRGDYRI